MVTWDVWHLQVNPTCFERLLGYMDNDWVSDVETHKGNSGYVFSLGKVVISWVTSGECHAIKLCWVHKTWETSKNGILSQNPVIHGRWK